MSQNLQENTCARVSFLTKLQASGLQLYLKRDSAHVLSCEFCEISKNTFFTEHIWTTASIAAMEHLGHKDLVIISYVIVFLKKNLQNNENLEIIKVFTKAFVKIKTLCEQNVFQNHGIPASLENICDEIKINC